MNCAIMQPNYIPWRGSFHLIQQADVYVFYEDVQYTKRSWRNRNRIKTPAGPRWLTVPVNARGSIVESIPIAAIEIDWARPWNVSHREQLHQCYRRAPHYRRYAELLDRIYELRHERLADFTIATTILLARELGIPDTRFVRSSELGVPGRGTERVVGILQAVGADRLLNGPTARAYTDEGLLARHGISTEYLSYEFPEYPQLHGPFVPDVSILDLLLMVGPAAGDYIWG